MMDGMDDLIAFLAFVNARLDEDEQTARASIGHSAGHLNGADPLLLSIWKVTDRPATGTFVTTRDQWDRSTEIVPTYGGMHAAHIARHDPARVLAEVDAKRRRLELLADAIHRGHDDSDIASELLPLEALPFADHPDYQDTWRP